MAVTLTERAAAHVVRYLDKRGHGLGLRLGFRQHRLRDGGQIEAV